MPTDDPEDRWEKGQDHDGLLDDLRRPRLVPDDPPAFTREDAEALTVLLRWGTITLAAYPEGPPPTLREQVIARDAIAKIRAHIPPE